MEEILILLFQFLAEIFLELLLFFPFEWLGWQRESDRPNGCGLAIIVFIIGGGIGGLSVAIARGLYLPTAALRVANLIISPMAVGGAAYWLARSQRSKRQSIEAMSYFWLGFVFSLGFNCVRLAFGSR